MFWRAFRWGVTLAFIAIMIAALTREQPREARHAGVGQQTIPTPKRFNLQ
jgi:hypothetical protein